MMERGERWTEAMLAALEPHEHDFQEFKGRGWMQSDDGLLQPHFLIALSKQVSAFANGGGGRVFIGLDDHGCIDGGVPVNLKGGTRAWLEDVVTHAVDPPLRRCNVFEVRGDGPQSRIAHGCAVYVLDLPQSQDAPHQSKDHRYYLRIAGKSRPMGHLHVQDVLRRSRHPAVTVARLSPFGAGELVTTDPRGPVAFVQLRCLLENTGRSLAHHVGLELLLPRPFAGAEVRRRMRESGESNYSHSPGEMRFFRYLGAPVFPTQEVYGMSVWVVFHRNNLALARGGATLRWVVYADDAVPVRAGRELASFQIVQKAMAWLDQQ